MKLRHALIATATAVALVAAPAIAAAPAQATEKATGKTLVSFKKEYAGIFKLVAPIKPAKFIDSRLTFPVTGVDGNFVLHSGGIKVGAIKAKNPVIRVNAANKHAKVYFDIGGTETLLFYAKHFKIKADGVGGQVWQGNLHLTKDAAVVSVLNNALGVDSLTPGLGLGQMRVTIKK